jgi:transposase
MADVPPAPDEAAALHAAKARLRQVIGANDTGIAVLREQVEALTAQVAELRARLENNSRNSSKPPSAEGLAKPAPRSLRKKTGRKPGRPKGQPGVRLELTDHPGEVVTHEPGSCAGCGTGLLGAEVTAAERRQVIGLPGGIGAVVTGHRLVSRRCGCGTIPSGTAPAGVTAPVPYGPRLAAACAYLWHGQFPSRSRTCEAAGGLFGVPVSPGAVAGTVNRIAAKQLANPSCIGAQTLPESQHCDVGFANAANGSDPLLDLEEYIVVVRRDRLLCPAKLCSRRATRSSEIIIN